MDNVILGVDPGSRVTGYGLIQHTGSEFRYIDSGAIKLGSGDVANRMLLIEESLSAIIKECKPTSAAIEQVFVHRNPQSALKLGQARGAAMVAIAKHDLTLAEYSARSIKQAVVGYGGAQKAQMQYMVKTLLKLDKVLQADEADALAIAICHGHVKSSKLIQIEQAK